MTGCQSISGIQMLIVFTKTQPQSCSCALGKMLITSELSASSGCPANDTPALVSHPLLWNLGFQRLGSCRHALETKQCHLSWSKDAVALHLIPVALCWVQVVTKREACKSDGKNLRMKRLSLFPRSCFCTIFSSSFRILSGSNSLQICEMLLWEEKKQSVLDALFVRRVMISKNHSKEELA